MSNCIIAEINGSIGSLYLAGSSKAVWKDSEPDKIVFHVATGSEIETRKVLKERKEIEDEVESIVPNSSAFLNARLQYVQRWNYFFSRGTLEKGSDGFITTGTAGVNQEQFALTTWFSYDFNNNVLSHYNGVKFNLGSLPKLPSGVKIVGGLAIANLIEYKLGPSASIQKIWVDSIRQGNDYGMVIHTSFEVENMMGKNGQVLIYFEDSNGFALRDTNNNFRTSSGEVALSSNFTPRFVQSVYSDYDVFIPYRELHLSHGKHDLRFIVKIYDVQNNNFIGTSEYQHFSLTL